MAFLLLHNYTDFICSKVQVLFHQMILAIIQVKPKANSILPI